MGFFEKNTARMKEVIEDIIRRQAHGIAVDYDALADQYPDLMPDLADRIRRLRAIESAASNARSDTKLEDFQDSEPQLDYLRRLSTRYDILDPISYGAQGIVYKAVQLSTKRTVAIKFLLDGPLANPRQRRRFKRETELVSRLRHPNVVSVYEAGEIEGRPYVVMEYIDGLAIDDYITVEQVPLRDTLTIFEKVCSAVSTAHQNGIIHRDLKPSNILVDFNGEPHVLDFGLAKETHAPDDITEISLPDQLIGTLPYLSPEHVRGRQIDTRSDIYALGIIFYEFIVGDRPYSVNGDRAAALQAILYIDPKPPRKALRTNGEKRPWRSTDIVKDLEQIILKTLRKSADARYQSADALAEDLRNLLAGRAVSARADSAWYVFRKTAKRYRVHSSIAAGFLLLLVSSLVGMTHLWRRTETIATEAVVAAHAGALVKLGSVDRDGARVDLAIDAFMEAIQLAESLNSDSPVLKAQLFSAYQRLADLLIKKDRSAEAIPYAAKAVQLAEAAFKRDPSLPISRSQLFGSLMLRGRLESSSKNHSEACALYSRAIELQRELCRDFPDNDGLQTNLANALGWRGSAERLLNDAEASLVDLKDSQDIYEQLRNKEPTNGSRGVNLVQAYSRLSAWHLGRKSPENDKHAQDLLDQAVARLEQTKLLPNSEDRRAEIDELTGVIHRNCGILDNRLRKSVASSD
ncbi:MAG: serine/threonine-protein kinase [Planctomycetota bacterium]